MFRVVEEDGDVVCQASASCEDINRKLKEEGVALTLPVSAFK